MQVPLSTSILVTRGKLIASMVTALVLVGLLSAGCGGSSTSGVSTGTGIQVVAAENFWGNIAQQEAGHTVHVASIIVNPNTDPHAYEPSVADARLVANARYVILNGAGYDPWMQKLLAGNPVSGRRVLIVSDLVGVREGGNPHLWYSPPAVLHAASRISTDLETLDSHQRGRYQRRHTTFLSKDLRQYRTLIASIARRYHGVPVGATESIFQYLAAALHLTLITPDSYMKAISEGNGPTAQDKRTFERQIAQGTIKVLVYNSQNTTSEVTALVDRARSKGIPVVAISETLSPTGASFQAWQVRQLLALQAALSRGTGR